VSRRPLLVVALGGNAISPPAGSLSYGDERAAVAASARELGGLAATGYRLLVVHGNGPQVGRLMRADFAPVDLDIHVAQTQGELGYLIASALEQASGEATAALISRTQVSARDPAFGRPDKPVGPVLSDRPSGPAVWLERAAGWRRVVASPRPRLVPELPVIRELLTGAHVVAGGGGGVPVDARGRPCQAVVDKDRIAALLASALQASALVFATDVEGAFRDFDGPAPALLSTLSPAQARGYLEQGIFGAGTMAPKVESALDFAVQTRRPAVIARLGALGDGLAGRSGTRIAPDGAADSSG